jgi:hypothetical protein
VSEVKILTIPFLKSVSGESFIEPIAEIVHFKNNFGGIIPNTVFCPACSTLTEYDSKWGEVKEKRNLEEHDYSFEVGYATKDGETYAQCLKCEFDLRLEAPKLEPKEKTTKTVRPQVKIVNKITANTEIEWIGQAKYEGGFFTMSKEEFMRVVKSGQNKDKRIAASIGGSNYCIEWDKLFSEYKEIKSDTGFRIGIARNHWTNL